MSVEDILADYPYLEHEDIWQVLRYAAWLSDDSVYDLQLAAA